MSVIDEAPRLQWAQGIKAYPKKLWGLLKGKLGKPKGTPQ